MNSKQNYKFQLIVILILILFILFFSIIYQQDKQITKLEKENPYIFYSNQSNEQYRYFYYKGIEHLFYEKKDFFYKYEYADNSLNIQIFCNIPENKCKVEIMDYICLSNYDTIPFPLTENETGCVTIYHTEGKTEKRVY